MKSLEKDFRKLLRHFLAACTPGKGAGGADGSGSAKASLQVGGPAPEVTLSLHDGRQLSLASLRGAHVLLFFYPKDRTPG